MSVPFSELNLSKPLLSAVSAEGYSVATPIQAQAIPLILEGRDVLGSAQTGTGKTAAFALPMLQRLSEGEKPQGRRPIRGLVLCPTRELALQIEESLRVYGRGLSLRHLVVFGGVNQNPQVRALRSGVDILVATPGRLMDLMGQGHIDLGQVEILVLDEADRMLDMGFIPDIRRIAASLPSHRQTLLFSATIPPTIHQLAKSLLKNPVKVEVAPTASTAVQIDQSVYFVDKRNKPTLLAHLVENKGINCGIVFTRTKHGADRVVRQLDRQGIGAAAIHGNKSQNNRQRVLEGFRRGKIRILVATDVAARGIDVDGITHVVNYDLTHEPETYVHRIGRTARAGATGSAVSFCDRDERSYLKAIQRLLRRDLTVQTDHPEYSAAEADASDVSERRAQPTSPRAAERTGHRGGGRPSGPSGFKPKQGPGKPKHAAPGKPGKAKRPQGNKGPFSGGGRKTRPGKGVRRPAMAGR